MPAESKTPLIDLFRTRLPWWLISRGWWAYVFERPWTWRKAWCRWRMHPPGPAFYNVGGTEPDWRCKNCEDYLG